MMAHSCSLLFAKQIHRVAMLCCMFAGGGMVLIIASADRIPTSCPPIVKASQLCYTRQTLITHRTLKLSHHLVLHPLQRFHISSNHETVLKS